LIARVASNAAVLGRHPRLLRAGVRRDALPEADQAFWARLRAAGGVERFLDEPDVVLTEGNALVVGRVPAA